MRNLAIFGAGQMGKKAKKLVETYYSDEYKLVCFADNDIAKHGIQMDGISVVSSEKLLELYKLKEIDCVAACLARSYEIEIFLIQHKIPLIRIDSFGIFSLTLPFFNKENRPKLPYLETHAAYHCNLKCRGCSHFSNTEKYPRFPSIEIFERDLERLSQLFFNVETFRLLGGEPFLNPELPKLMSLTRQYFPLSSITVASNGLLICKQNPKIWEYFLEHDIDICITCYPPVLKLLSKIESTLKKYGVRYTISKPVTSFRANLTKQGNSDPIKSLKFCENVGHARCTIFNNGKLAKCPPLLLADTLNQYFNHDYSNEADIIDIHNPQITGWDILQKISSPANFCKYCSERPRFFEWKSGGSIEFSDWLA